MIADIPIERLFHRATARLAEYAAEINAQAARIAALEEALREGRRAIGGHFAPGDCYATGPVTGDAYRDLVQCPACSFVALYDEVMKDAKP